MPTAVAGILLGLLAGALNGSYALPFKRASKWSWENTWFVWSFITLLILPWAIALTTVPDLMSAYANAGTRAVALVFIFGLLWGYGIVAIGQAIYAVGISLAFAIGMGLSIGLGSLIPMLSKPYVFGTSGGLTVTAGVVVLLVGIATCAKAGGAKEARLAKVEGKKTEAAVARPSFARGLLLCILAGIFTSMINLAFNFGTGVMNAAKAIGASAGAASDAIWALVMLGGFIANAAYSAVKLQQNRTWPAYRAEGTGTYWLMVAISGCLLMFSVTIYGRAALMMGKLGGSAGWAIFMATCVVVSNLWGIITGEWKQAKGGPLNTMFGGIAIIIAAIAVIGYGSSLMP